MRVQSAAKNNALHLKILFAVYLLGLVHWVLFVHYGHPTHTSFDWGCIHQWLDVIKQSLAQGKMPFFASYYEKEMLTGQFLWGDRFFATPYIIPSPHTLLLAIMTVPNFISLQLALAYSVGFWGCYQWIQKFKLSTSVAVIFLLIASFNGSIVGRMGVGHIQLVGYMIVPTFFWGLYRFLVEEHLSQKETFCHALGHALFLGVLLLQGATHNINQMIIVGSLVALCYPRKIPYYLLSLFIFLLLSSYYLYPNIFYGNYMGRADRVMNSGYGHNYAGGATFLPYDGGLFSHTINTFYHIWVGLIRPYTAATDATWEYSLYIGKLGVATILFGLFAFLYKHLKSSPWWRKENILAIPLLIIFFLSLRDNFHFLFIAIQKILPIPAVDRLASRMLIYPFYFCLLLSVLGLNRVQKKDGMQRTKMIALSTVAVVLGLSLFTHSYGWSVAQTEANFELPEGFMRHQFFTKIYDKVPEAGYKNTVFWSYGLSIFFYICALTWAWRQRKIGLRNATGS